MTIHMGECVMEYLIIVSKVLPIILLFFLGYLFRTFQFIAPKTIEDFKKLIINVSLPSLLFLSFSSTEFQANHIVIVGTVFLICVFLLLIGLVLRKLLRYDSPFFPLLLTGFEAGMLGYSIFAILFGTENVFKFAIIDLGQVTFVFFVMVALLQKIQDGGKTSLSQLFTSFAKTPVIVAIFLGIVVQKTEIIHILQNVPIASSILDTLTLIGALTTPLICLVIGYEIHFEDAALGKTIKVVAIRVLLLAMIGFAVNYFIIDGILHLDRTFQAAVMVMFLLPPPFIIPIYIKTEDKDNQRFVINTLSIHTIVTIFAMLFVGAVYL